MNLKNDAASCQNIRKFGDTITLELVLLVSKSINIQVPPIFSGWFTLSGNLHIYETSWPVNEHLNMPTFWPKSVVAFACKS